MKIMPNEILRIQAKLRDLRAGNISSNDMFGPIISPKSILSIHNEELPQANFHIGQHTQHAKSPKSDIHNFIN